MPYKTNNKYIMAKFISAITINAKCVIRDGFMLIMSIAFNVKVVNSSTL